MSRLRLWLGLAVSVLLGTAAALVPALDMETDRVAAAALRAPGDRVRAAIDELRRDRVHVPPDGRSMLDEAAEARLETLLAEADPAIYVVVWALTTQAGYRSAYDVTDQLGAAVDPDAVFVVWEGKGRGHADVLDGDFYTSMPFEGDPEARVTELVAQLDGEPIRPQHEEGAGDAIGGAVAGAVGGAGAYGLLMTLVGFLRLRRGRPFLVPGPWQGDR